jgi:AmmeMemoRadiSam system protein B
VSGRAGPLPSVKEPHLAGRWYPAAPDVLAREVEGMLAAGGAARPGVLGLVVPHGTYQHSGPTAARGFAAAGPGVRRAVVLAPSHFATFRGAALLPLGGYRTPLGEMRIDAAASAALAESPLVRPNPALFMREHALEIQLPLLQALAPGCVLVPLLVGTLGAGDAAALAAVLRPLAGPGTLLVASSDLTHYGRRFDYLPVPASDAAAVAGAVQRLDEAALERIVARDADGFAAWVEETGATICGRSAIEVLLRALPPDARGERLGYTTSLALTGDYEHTVSYAAVAFASAA